MVIASAITAMKTKIMCHSENSMTSWPMPGATTGMTMNTMKTSDITSAMRAAAEHVADEGDGDDARRRRADALDEAQREQRREARREGRAESRDDIDRQAERAAVPRRPKRSESGPKTSCAQRRSPAM